MMRVGALCAVIAIVLSCGGPKRATPSPEPPTPTASRSTGPDARKPPAYRPGPRGSKLTDLSSCTLGERVVVAKDGPDAVEPDDDRSLADISAGFAQSGGVIVWGAADRHGPNRGTWVIQVDHHGNATSPLTHVDHDLRFVDTQVRFHDAGATAIGVAFDPDIHPFVRAFEAYDPVKVETVAEGWPIGVSDVYDDRVVIAVTERSNPWRARVYELRMGTLEHRLLADAFDLRMRGRGRGRRLAAGEGWWALLDGEDVRINDTLVPGLGTDLAAVMCSATKNTVLVFATSPDGIVETELSPEGERLASRPPVPIADFEFPYAPGLPLIIGPGSPRGTAVGSTINTEVEVKPRWLIEDNGSWAQTWVGWTGFEYAFLYTSPDQAELSFRPFVCD